MFLCFGASLFPLLFPYAPFEAVKVQGTCISKSNAGPYCVLPQLLACRGADPTQSAHMLHSNFELSGWWVGSSGPKACRATKSKRYLC